MEAIVPGHGRVRVVRRLVPRAKQQSDALRSSSAAGDIGVPRTGSRIARAMQPSAARGETSGLRPIREPPEHRRGCLLAHESSSAARLPTYGVAASSLVADFRSARRRGVASIGLAALLLFVESRRRPTTVARRLDAHSRSKRL